MFLAFLDNMQILYANVGQLRYLLFQIFFGLSLIKYTVNGCSIVDPMIESPEIYRDEAKKQNHIQFLFFQRVLQLVIGEIHVLYWL